MSNDDQDMLAAFQRRMHEAMREAAECGRNGWQTEPCELLYAQMQSAIHAGRWVSVANYAAMLDARNYRPQTVHGQLVTLTNHDIGPALPETGDAISKATARGYNLLRAQLLEGSKA